MSKITWCTVAMRKLYVSLDVQKVGWVMCSIHPVLPLRRSIDLCKWFWPTLCKVIDCRSRKSWWFLQDLFSLNENTKCDTHDLLSCTCDSSETGDNKQEEITQPANHRACQLGQAGNSKKVQYLALFTIISIYCVCNDFGHTLGIRCIEVNVLRK